MNPRAFRKADVAERRDLLAAELGARLGADALGAALDASAGAPAMLALADRMTENAFGSMPVPLGLAVGFVVDGRQVDLPLATEEPSVVAAASFMGGLVARHGGFATWATPPEMDACVYLQGAPAAAEAALAAGEGRVRAALAPALAAMEARGGGLRRLAWQRLEDGTLKYVATVDVRDAMGANLLNGCAELLRPLLEELSGGRALMAILSNQAAGRRAGARFSVPVGQLSRGAYHGMALAERIVAAGRLARIDPARAVTHNKGIMNGVSALALATGNDTRAVEAAVHAWACRDGAYRGLGEYRIEGDRLAGELELPLPFATVGGATAAHPAARLCLALLEAPDAVGLSRLAAALGLAQNFAALNALCGEGIMSGHMRLHARRLAQE